MKHRHQSLCKMFLINILIVILAWESQAQEQPFATQVVKVNLAPVVIQSYGISYETVLTSNLSIGLSASLRPKNGFPYRSKIEDYYTDNDVRIRDIAISQFSVTPELRYYFLHSSSLRGWYLGTFFQFARYGLESKIDYIGSGSPTSPMFDLDGGMNTYTVGASLGYQWKFGNRFYLDWQIVAPHFGINRGKFTGENTNNVHLNESQQRVIRNKPNEFDIPLVKLDIRATGDQIEAQTKGLWAGARLMLSVGYGF